GVIVVLLSPIVSLAMQVYGNTAVTVPAIKQQVPFPIFLPDALPEKYRVVSESFTFSEEAFLFRAENTEGSTIAFTTQKKPQIFDFDNFYQTQLRSTSALADTPYSSVLGKALTSERQLLSIVTPDTWIMVSTLAPFGQKASLKSQKH